MAREYKDGSLALLPPGHLYPNLQQEMEHQDSHYLIGYELVHNDGRQEQMAQ